MATEVGLISALRCSMKARTRSGVIRSAGSYREVVRIVRLEEAKPPPIGKLDRLARPFCKVSARSSGLVEDVTRLIGGAEGLAVGLRPLVDRKMLKRSHCFHPFVAFFSSASA